MTATGARLATIGWGLFCACSWTWVIGMYLPRIMIQRDGWAGFLVFAIPNVIGCAGFGYVLATRLRSERMVADHRFAMVAFSVVAIGFHILFWSMIGAADAMPRLGSTAAMWWMPFGIWALGLGLAWCGDRAWLWLAVATYAVSLGVFGAYVFAGAPEFPPASTGPELLWLAPVIVIGFLLSPYLDLTFHRAQQRSPSKHAFFVFGIAFSVMLILTAFIWFPARWRVIAAIHLLVQSVFTVGAHLREVRVYVRCPTRRAVLLFAPLAVLPVYPVIRTLTETGDVASLVNGVYLRYLVAYGLLFPAYVLLFVGPWRPLSVTGRNIAIVAACVVLPLMPLYELGFLREWAVGLLVVPVAVVVWGMVRSRQSQNGEAVGL